MDALVELHLAVATPDSRDVSVDVGADAALGHPVAKRLLKLVPVDERAPRARIKVGATDGDEHHLSTLIALKVAHVPALAWEIGGRHGRLTGPRPLEYLRRSLRSHRLPAYRFDLVGLL